VMAYSSVAHMTICAFLLRWIGFIVGLSHVVISPLMFLMVYVSYISSGSRLLSESLRPWMLGIVLLLNVRFPLVGSFMAELYVVIIIRGLLIIIFLLQYFVIGIIHMNIFFKIKRCVSYENKGWIILLLMMY
jgi:hypothetical protein